MKIALFGGFFNPIHTDHLRIGMYCHEQLGFDEVWIIPCPFKFFQTAPSEAKSGFPQATTADRLAMIRHAVQDLSYFRIKKYELEQRPENVSTYQTFSFFCQQFPHHDFYIIIGSDQLKHLPKWHSFNRLKKQKKIIVFERNLGFQHTLSKRWPFLVYQLDYNLRLSSKRIRAGYDLEHQMPAVNKYINDHLLYIDVRLRQHLPQQRIDHCLATAQTAAAYARQHQCNPDHAFLAGAYHDLTKYWLPSQHLTLIKQQGWPELQPFLQEPQPTWHAISSAVYVKAVLKVKEPEIINAILHHTLGHDRTATLMDKIIYVSDKTEPHRSGKTIAFYRNLADNNLTGCYQKLICDHYLAHHSLKGRDLSDQQANTISHKNYQAWNQ